MTKEIVKEASEPKFKLITGVVKRAQKFIVYGKTAVGKSCFATQFPNPIMIQAEDCGGTIDSPRLPVCHSVKDMFIQLDEVLNGSYGKYDTVIVDSIKVLERLIGDKSCADLGIDTLGDIKFGVAYANAMVWWSRFTDVLDKFIEKDINVVLIGHERVRTVKGTVDDEYETTTVDLMAWGTQYTPTEWLYSWSDHILYLAHKIITKTVDSGLGGSRTIPVGTGNRVIYTGSENPAYMAKSRFNMPPELPYKKGEGYKVIEKYLNVTEKGTK